MGAACVRVRILYGDSSGSEARADFAENSCWKRIDRLLAGGRLLALEFLSSGSGR